LRDPERFAAAAADDGGLGQYGRDDADVAAAVADGLDPHTTPGGAVPRGRPAEAAGGVARGRRGVGLQGSMETFRRRTVAALRLGGERDQREATAGMRFLGVIQAQLLGDREESAVVVAAGAGC